VSHFKTKSKQEPYKVSTRQSSRMDLLLQSLELVISKKKTDTKQDNKQKPTKK
jgi:hypothetical protein